MNVSRTYHTATLLNNGKVLVAGGYNGYINLASAELYDPDTGIWSLTGNMNATREFHTATLLNNGKVLVAGGSNLASAELYDPVTGIWSPAGSMNVSRTYHTATFLNDGSGKVLVAGGWGGGADLASAELYDPVTGIWSFTGSMNIAHRDHTATLINNGKVLVTGGSGFANAELYDPVTGIWSPTGSMSTARRNHTAMLLNNGKVLVAGGTNLASAELYDPATSNWSTTGSMRPNRQDHTATLLNNGKVLVAGGEGGPDSAIAELYDPATGTWSSTSSMNVGRAYHTATLLNDGSGKVLVTGGRIGMTYGLTNTELGTLKPANTFTGTLTLPSGWLSSATISTEFVGNTSVALLNAGAFSNDNNTWSSWMPATSSVPVTTTWYVGGEGANKPVYLRLRDVNGQVGTVVSGTVNVDLTKPISSMTALPATSPANISLAWSGSDTLSGLATYDVQVRAGIGGTWTDVFTNTSATSTIYNGVAGMTYYFRARAKDVAGNVEDWAPDYDTYTLVDTDAPTGSLVINNGALSTTFTGVKLTLSAQDISGSVVQMSFSNDGTTWDNWQTYAGSANWSLPGGDGLKTVYVRFKDIVGNISATTTSTITLDTTAGTEYGLSINQGSLFTNQAAVTLSIAAKQFTPQMMISNDGGFSGAIWEPYNSLKPWTITQYGSYVLPRVVYVRYKDVNGVVSSTYQDDIILDVTPPTGTVSVLGAKGIQALDSTVTLSLSATDDVSGVGQMMLSNQADFSGAIWENYATNRAWTLGSNTTIYVKFKDNAGNISSTNSTSITPKERIVNGSFETYKADHTPKNWTAVKFNASLDGKDTSTHKVGKASLKVTGAGTTIKTLTQNLNTLSGAAGDIFTLSFYVSGSDLSTGGMCQIEVFLYNTSTQVGKITKKCPTVANFSWKKLTANLAATTAYTRAVIKITIKKNSGTLWFDGVSLMR
jgi:hypothetical protein